MVCTRNGYREKALPLHSPIQTLVARRPQLAKVDGERENFVSTPVLVKSHSQAKMTDYFPFYSTEKFQTAPLAKEAEKEREANMFMSADDLWPSNISGLLQKESDNTSFETVRSLPKVQAQAEPGVVTTPFLKEAYLTPHTSEDLIQQQLHLVSHLQGESTEGCSFLEVKLAALSNDLQTIKKYLQESTGLLSTLAKIIKVEALEGRSNSDAPKASMASNTSFTTGQGTATPRLRDIKTIPTKVDKTKLSTETDIHKDMAKCINTKKEAKQKNTSTQPRQSRNYKRGLKKLFALIPSSKPTAMSRRKSKKSTSKLRNSASGQGKVNSSRPANPGFQKIDMATQTHWINQEINGKGEKDNMSPEKTETADGSKLPMTKQQNCEQIFNGKGHLIENWNLVLDPNKLVFIKVPKPGKLAGVEDCKTHVLGLLEKVLPGGLFLSDIDTVEYLDNDQKHVDVIVSLVDPNIAKFVIRTRDLFLKQGMVITRFFKQVPIQKVPDDTMS
nr:PREDICTED: uncharacterized protein LOC107982495 [Anolis carolinensis]|eukprot:XP_016847254.1 PREDICTED: uncharacterized protein LOC107982495 [Anolis carolinensis]